MTNADTLKITYAGSIKNIPGKATNKQLTEQGDNAAYAGFDEKDCPYYKTSTAEKYWLKGFRYRRNAS